MRKLQRFYFLLLLMIIMMSSCNFFTKSDSTVKYIAVKLGKSDSKISIMDIDGKIVMEDEFASSSSLEFSGDLITETLSDGAIKYWKIDGKKVKQIGKDKYADGTPFSEGYAIVRDEKGMLSLIDEEAKEVVANLSKISNHAVVRIAVPNEGLMRFKTTEGLWGYADTKGEVVIEPKFTSCDNFNDGLARAIDKNGLFTVIDAKGEVKLKGKEGYRYMPIVDGEVIPFKSDESKYWGLMKLDGDVLLKDSKYESMSLPQHKIMSVSLGTDQWGVVNFEGEVLGDLRNKFEQAPFLCSNDMIVVNSDKEARLYDAKGILIKKLEDFDYVYPLAENRFLAQQKNDKYVILDGEGKEISKDAFILGNDDLGSVIQHSSKGRFEDHKNSYYTLESKYFEFDDIFKSIFASISVNGTAKVTANSTIASVIKTYPFYGGTSSSGGSGSSYVSKSNDYEFIMESLKNGKSASSVEETGTTTAELSPTEIGDGYEGTAPAADSTVAPYPESPSNDVKDNYPYLSLYSDTYSPSGGYASGVNYSMSFKFNQYLKQEVTGMDPVFTNYVTVVGYELNNNARLQYLTITFNFNDVDREVFWKQLEKKALEAGFVKKDNGTMVHKANAAKVISFSQNNFYYVFN